MSDTLRQELLLAFDPLWVLHHLMQHEAEHCGQIMALRTRAERVTNDE